MLSALVERQTDDYQPLPKYGSFLDGLTRLKVHKPPAYQKNYL